MSPENIFLAVVLGLLGWLIFGGPLEEVDPSDDHNGRWW